MFVNNMGVVVSVMEYDKNITSVNFVEIMQMTCNYHRQTNGR